MLFAFDLLCDKMNVLNIDFSRKSSLNIIWLGEFTFIHCHVSFHLIFFLTTILYASNESMFSVDQIPINEHIIVKTRNLGRKLKASDWRKTEENGKTRKGVGEMGSGREREKEKRERDS